MTEQPAPSSLGPTSPERETPQLDEHDLVRRAQQRDAAACQELVRRYYDGVYRLAYRFLSNAEDARDVAQDTFLRAFGAIDRFDLNLSFKPWVRRIAMNRVTDEIRLRYRSNTASLDTGLELAGDADDPADVPAAQERAERVREIVDTLPPKYRTVLVLRDMEGQDMDEIASMVGSPRATVRWRLHQARKMFKRKWERIQQP